LNKIFSIAVLVKLTVNLFTEFKLYVKYINIFIKR